MDWLAGQRARAFKNTDAHCPYAQFYRLISADFCRMFALAAVGYFVVFGGLRRGDGNHTGVYPPQDPEMGGLVPRFGRDCGRIRLLLAYTFSSANDAEK
ncbi:MAG: hypothetical protein ABSG67_08485 [Thermoguttaceae bacterium]